MLDCNMLAVYLCTYSYMYINVPYVCMCAMYVNMDAHAYNYNL